MTANGNDAFHGYCGFTAVTGGSWLAICTSHQKAGRHVRPPYVVLSRRPPATRSSVGLSREVQKCSKNDAQRRRRPVTITWRVCAGRGGSCAGDESARGLAMRGVPRLCTIVCGSFWRFCGKLYVCVWKRAVRGTSAQR